MDVCIVHHSERNAQSCAFPSTRLGNAWQGGEGCVHRGYAQFLRLLWEQWSLSHDLRVSFVGNNVTDENAH